MLEYRKADKMLKIKIEGAEQLITLFDCYETVRSSVRK